MSYLKKVIKFCVYLVHKIRLIGKKATFTIMDLETTLNTVIDNHCSLIRYGDGELFYMAGFSMPGNFQNRNMLLQEKLLAIATEQHPNLLVCMPEPLVNFDNIKLESRMYWSSVKVRLYQFYSNLLVDKTFGNSFVSRPYMAYEDKSKAGQYFCLWKKIWEDKDILLIEGTLSRTGVGNDLFSNARTVSRIICPPTNAFEVYNEIFQSAMEIGQNLDNLIVLIALGPTAKPLTYDLNFEGFQAIDIGHIDSEYEWFLKKVNQKIVIDGKHTAERDKVMVDDCFDESYLNSIVYKVGIS